MKAETCELKRKTHPYTAGEKIKYIFTVNSELGFKTVKFKRKRPQALAFSIEWWKRIIIDRIILKSGICIDLKMSQMFCKS